MPEVFSLEKWEKESAQLAAEWNQPTVGAPAEEEFSFDVGNTKSRPVTKDGKDIFVTDEHGVQYFTPEGFKENEEAATAWMEIAGHAFDHMFKGFLQDPVIYDRERHGTGVFSFQMGSDRIVAAGEAGLRAADGIWDFVKASPKFLARPFQSEETVDEVKYNQYLELTAKMNGLYGVWKKDGQVVPPGTEGAMKVKSPESFAGNMRRAWSGEGDKGAAAIDDMINPQAADSWSMVLDPVWLIPGGGLAKVQKILATGARGAKLAAALKKVKNLAPQGGKLSAAAQWAKDAAKTTGGVVRNPATRAVGGAGRLVAGAGSALEYAGSKIAKYPKTAFVGGAWAGYSAIEDDRGAADILAAIGAGAATAKAVPTVLAKKGAALRGVGEFTRGTAKVAEVGTFGRAIQRGMYSASTNKALKLMDNAPLNKIAHGSGQLANLLVRGSVFASGMGYVIAGKEGAAAGMGVGVLGAPIGALQARAISGAMKFPFYKKNKEGKWEKTEANSILDVPHQDLVDNFLGHMSKGDREALLTPKEYEDGTIVHMTPEKLYSMALLDAYAKGILKKGKDGPEGDLVIRYMDDSDIRAEFPDQPDWLGTQGVHRAEVDGKPLIIINRNADDPLRTLAHEIFHPDWKTADGDDPLTGLRAEMQNHLFGVRDGADGVIFDGLFNEKEFLSLENQYLGRLYDRKSKEGREGYEEHMKSRNMQERREYIAGEMLSESFGNFAEAARGDVVAHGRRILRGAKMDKVTEFVTGGLVTKFDLGLLGRMRQALGKMGIEFDSAGTPASSIFKDPTTGKKKWTLVDGKRVSFKEGGEGLTNSPEMEKLIADYVVAKDKVLERLTPRTEGADEKAVITAKQILAKNDPVLVQKFANTGMFKLDNDGNVLFEGGAPVLLSRTERKLNEQTQSEAVFAQLDSVTRVEFDSEGMVRKENDKGDVSYTGRFMNEEQLSAVLSLPDEVLPKSVKNKISKLNEMMTKGFDDAGNLVGDHSPNFLIQYYAATKGSKYTSKASMSHQLAAPYGWSISQAGNFNLQTLSVGKFEAKINKWWGKAGKPGGGRYRAFTELFDRSQEQFRADVVEYLHNQAAGIKNPNSAKTDAIADFLNALPKEQKDAMPNRLSTDKEHVVPVSLRVDRMESIQSSLGTPMPVNYARLRVNYKPTTPKGDEGTRYMPKGERPEVTSPSQFGEGTPGKMKFEDKPHPLNRVIIKKEDGTETHSRTMPSRDPIGKRQSKTIPKHLRFKDTVELDAFVERGVEAVRKTEGKLYGEGERYFYEQMHDAAIELGGKDLSRADLNLRLLAYLSPRTSVPANFTKSFGSGISSFMTEVASGTKAGNLKQTRAISSIIKEWDAGEPFGAKVEGVDNKVENFYLNPMAELLKSAKKEGRQIPDYIKKDPRFRDEIELSRLSTNDMWHMAAMAELDPAGGNVWPGFVMARDKNGAITGFAWSDTTKGRIVKIDSPDGKKVMGRLAEKAENAKAVAREGREFTIKDLTPQELNALKYKDGEIMVFDVKTEGGLNAKGEGPLYDHVQMITGMIADQINKTGGYQGRMLDAYNVQELMWADVKNRNPLKGMRDYDSFQSSVDAIMAYVRGGLEGEAPKSIEASTRSFNQWANQIVSGEIDTKTPGVWHTELTTARERLTKAGVKDPDAAIVAEIAKQLPESIERLANDRGLDIKLDEVSVDIGAFMDGGKVESNWAIYLTGRGKDFGNMDTMMRGAADQMAGNHIRPMKVEEKLLVEAWQKDNSTKVPDQLNTDLSMVMELGGGKNLSPDQVRSLIQDLAKLKDADGESFLSGLSKTGDTITIHDGYYRGEWTDTGFVRDKFFGPEGKKFDKNVTANESVIKEILSEYGLTIESFEPKVVRAESNPNLGKGKDNASKDNIRGGPETRTGVIRPDRGVQQPSKGGGDLQAIESLRGIFIDASRNAQPGKAGEPLYRFTADQIAQLRKQVTSSLPAKGTKLTKVQSDVIRQVASDVGVMSAEGNIGKVSGTISPEQAKTIFNAMMAIAENKPAKLLKSFDPSVMDAGLPFMQKKLKEGGEKLGRQAVRDRIEIDKRLKKIDEGLRKENQTKKDITSLRSKKKTALASRQKKVTDYHETIDRAVAEGIMSKPKAVELKKKFTNLDEKSDDIRFMPAGDVLPALNVRNELSNKFADEIVSGRKTIETRNSRSMDPLIGKRIKIIRTTGKGSEAEVIGEATVGKPVFYRTKAQFEKDFENHLVPSDSGFGFSDGGKYGYPMINAEKYDKPYKAPKNKGIVFTKNVGGPSADKQLRLERDLKKLKRN